MAAMTVLAASFAVAFAGPASAFAADLAPVNLGAAGNFAILSETGITDTGSHASAITGNIGASPITAAAMNDVYCSEITGTIYGVDAAYVGSGNQACFAGNPPAANKTFVDNAVLDMGTAYANAAGRTNPTATELGAGNIGGMTLAPGLYKWSSDVTIPTSVTLSGGSNAVWIFQIAGNLSIASACSLASGIKVILTGGAKASNVFWQVGGVTGATLGTYSTFNGTILSAKQIIIQTGAVLNGRALAQTQVTLDASTVGDSSTVSGTLVGFINGSSTVSGTLGGLLNGNSSSGSISGSVTGGSAVSGTLGGSTGGGGSGSISGTVSGGSSGGSGGGGGGSTSGLSSSGGGSGGGVSAPGQVLGISTDIPNYSPLVGAPNTGEGGAAPFNWMIISLVAFLAAVSVYRLSRTLGL